MHYYSFHIGDYMSHTRHLSLMEDLAFRRLLDFYYLHEQPIKQRDIARQIGMREYEQDVLTVLNEFFISTEQGFVSPRADKEITEFKNHQAKSAWGAFVRDNKKIAEKADKEVFISKFFAGEHREYIDTLIADHLDMMGTSTPHDATNNQEPITNNHKPKKDKATDVAFELPDWIPSETWNAFIEMRKRIKKPATDFAKKLIVGKLEKFKSQGQDVVAILEKSITSGWQDVFELKENKTFAQQAADIARTTVPAVNKGPDPALVKIEQDRAKAVPMPAHIRQQLMSVTRKI